MEVSKIASSLIPLIFLHFLSLASVSGSNCYGICMGSWNACMTQCGHSPTRCTGCNNGYQDCIAECDKKVGQKVSARSIAGRPSMRFMKKNFTSKLKTAISQSKALRKLKMKLKLYTKLR